MKRTNQGFTLIELIVTLSIVGIVAAIGVPSYNDIITKNRQTSTLNYFLNGLRSARSEAIKRSRQVVVCPSTNGTSCNASVNWDAGWIIFIDDDKDNTHDTSEMLIRVADEIDNGLTLVGDTNIDDYIRYRPNGISLESGTFTVCDSRGANEAKSIIINVTGRPRTSTKNATGGALSC